MDYKDKLRAFNSSDKYKMEVEFLNKLLGLPSVFWSQILDYGCGLGHAAYELCADGFDVNDYKEKEISNYYLNELPDKQYDRIYFMHSIAHIKNINDVLKKLRQKYNPTITVITPNKSWIDMVGDTKSDPTVIKHYNQEELQKLFIECGYDVYLSGQFGNCYKGINERLFLQAI